jgi:dihydroorotate dehydrogenase
MFQYVLRPILFLFPPETAHHITAFLIRLLFAIPGLKGLMIKFYEISDPRLEVMKRGLRFKNPVGLAAGFDKDALLYKNFRSFGFGFIEVGTVTPIAQDGNPKPRLFRLPKDRVLINRMGFNNRGVQAMAAQLLDRPKDLIVGGNIGKNKNTSEAAAVEDYLLCFEKLYGLVDYFTVNVSSPNTPGLRKLQEREPLEQLLGALVRLRNSFSDYKPILLKIAPDLSDDQLKEISEIVISSGIDGIVATNTTISRDGLISKASEIEDCGSGGLSGWPLKARSTRIIRLMREALGPEYLIMGCGGIEYGDDAVEKINAGADVVQIYTGFIYRGPKLVKEIQKQILKNASYNGVSA